MGTPTNGKKGTFSYWIKKHLNATNQIKYSNTVQNNGNRGYLQFNTSDNWRMVDEKGIVLVTNRVFRDTNAWYHIVVALDSTLGTTTDRFKLYVNGVQETSFQTSSYFNNGFPNQNVDFDIFAGGYSGKNFIGKNDGDSITSGYSISHFHYTDGYVYDASAFGSFDNVTGEWQINPSPNVTYGNNGFFILKDNNVVTDQSPNSNDFTVTGNLTKTEDSPSNIYATLNPLFTSSNTINFTNGNTRATGVDYQNQRTGGTLASSSGKFYFESKVTGNAGFGGSIIGIADYDNANIENSNTWFGSESNFVGFYAASNITVGGGGNTNAYGSISVGDIIGFAFDIDNGFAYVSINGTWQNSGVPTSGSTGTGNVNRTGNLNYNFSGKLMGIAGGFQVTDAWTSNFGNGYFGTTAVSSAGTNASGNGIFEYDVPTGYTALSTKGLNL